MSIRIVRIISPKGIDPVWADQYAMDRVDAQDAIEYAFKACRPTPMLIKACHDALVRAGVKPLPVPNALDA